MKYKKVMIMVASFYTFISFNNFHNQMALHVVLNRVHVLNIENFAMHPYILLLHDMGPFPKINV
jgi:hypothetical protein